MEVTICVIQSTNQSSSNLSGRLDIILGSGTLKNWVKNKRCKNRVQKTGSLLFKKRRGSLFFFKVPDPKIISGRPGKLE